jgi:hypothetical protein
MYFRWIVPEPPQTFGTSSRMLWKSSIHRPVKEFGTQLALVDPLAPFTNCVHCCTVFPHPAPENGIVMTAYQVSHTGHSRNLLRNSSENTWN